MIYILILILLIFLFLPIKIKLAILFYDNTLSIKIFNFKIFPRKEKKKKDISDDKKKAEKDNTEKSKESFLSKRLKKITIAKKDLFYNLINNKYKPKLKFDFRLNYSLNDAALTAQSFSGINTLFYLISSCFNLFFNFKSINTSIEPSFNSDIFINFKFNCILYINFTQIIFIAFILLKNLKLKGGAPLGDNYGV